MNIVILRGTLSSPPKTRRLPSGSTITGYEVTTRDERTRSVPVVWFDPPSSAERIECGAEVLVTGTVRRRFFRTGSGVTTSRTEVEASQVVPLGHRRRVARALERALAPALDD